MARRPGRYADGNPSATHAERMRAWGRGGDDPRGVRRRECGRASHFFGSREKSAFTDAANTQGRSPHRAVRVSAKRLRRLLPRARRDVAPVGTATPQTRAYLSHKESSQLSPNEKISGLRSSLGYPEIRCFSFVGERSSRSEARGCRAPPRGHVALPLSARPRSTPRAPRGPSSGARPRDARVDDAPRERRRARGARRGARDLARLEKKRARATAE